MKQAVVARILNISQTYVSKALAGKKTGEKSEKIKKIASIDYERIQELIKLEVIDQICEIAIDKGRSAEVKKTACILQCLNMKYRGENPLKKTEIDNEVVNTIFNTLVFNEDSVFSLLASESLYHVCETAINKSRNNTVKTVASLIQNINITLQNSLKANNDL